VGCLFGGGTVRIVCQLLSPSSSSLSLFFFAAQRPHWMPRLPGVSVSVLSGNCVQCQHFKTPPPPHHQHLPCACPCHGKDNIPDLQAVEIKKSTLKMKGSASVKMWLSKGNQVAPKRDNKL